MICIVYFIIMFVGRSISSLQPLVLKAVIEGMICEDAQRHKLDECES